MEELIFEQKEQAGTEYIVPSDYRQLLKSAGNKHELVNQLKKLITGKFVIKLKLTRIMGNLYINNKACLVRKNKFGKVHVYPGTTLLFGTPTECGGSNNHPRIAFKEGYCIVEVITNGFPNYDTAHMDIEILELKKILPGLE